MAITKLETPIKMTSSEVDQQYHGRWVLFEQPNIQQAGYVHAFGEDKPETQRPDYKELKKIVFTEFGGEALLVHGCKDRGRMNLHVEFHQNR